MEMASPSIKMGRGHGGTPTDRIPGRGDNELMESTVDSTTEEGEQSTGESDPKGRTAANDMIWKMAHNASHTVAGEGK